MVVPQDLKRSLLVLAVMTILSSARHQDREVPSSESECSRILQKIRHDYVVIPFPSDITGEWTSSRCEVRPGPEFLLRKYTFSRTMFRALQYYYFDSRCSSPKYSVRTDGKIKIRQWSFVVRGGTHTRYHLFNVRVVPFTDDVARSLQAEFLLSCPNVTVSRWKPFHSYEILNFRRRKNQAGVTEPATDCSQFFKWTMDELHLIKLQKRHVHHWYKATLLEELYTGAVHSTTKVGRHLYWPTSYQAALRRSKDEECKVCSHIRTSDAVNPPVLKPSPQASMVTLVGDWVSMQCETRPRGMFLTRHLTFHHTQQKWMGTYIYYRDPFCKNPSFTLVAKGDYEDVEPSPVVAGARHFNFSIIRMKITPHHHIIRDSLNAYNGTGCGHPGTWRLGVQQDVTETNGCRPLNIKLPNIVLEVIRTETAHNKMLLYIGQRLTDNDGSGRAPTYPTFFQEPLKRCASLVVVLSVKDVVQVRPGTGNSTLCSCTQCARMQELVILGALLLLVPYI